MRLLECIEQGVPIRTDWNDGVRSDSFTFCIDPKSYPALHAVCSDFTNISWLGVPTLKSPRDLFAYGDVLTQCQPDVLIECGTFHGGSALFFASVMDQLGRGLVITIDVKATEIHHPRIEHLVGSSVDARVHKHVCARLGSGRVMVSLDSLHTKEHVLKELELYGPLVTPGQYLVVEDTALGGHPSAPKWPEGPYEAVEAWLPSHPEFVRDFDVEPSCSLCPGGWLKRVGR